MALEFVLPTELLNPWKKGNVPCNFCNGKGRVVPRFFYPAGRSQTVKGRQARESELFQPNDTQQGKLTVAVERNSRNVLTLVSNPIPAATTTALAVCCEP